MFVNTLSSTAVLFPPMAGSGDGRSQSSISSMSSSAFSSQHFTQSDTEAEEEKRFIRRRAQRKQHPQLPMTPSAVMLRRREFLPPLHFASCSTPRSSLEDLLLDQNTSVYFRPLRQPPRGGSRHPERREAEQRKQQQQLKALQQQQQLLISQAYGHAYSGVQQRPSRRITEGGKHSRAETGKNSHILRKPRHVHRHGSRRRQSSNNPLMAAFLYGDGEPEDGEARCSSPILLDFRVSTDSDGGGEDQMTPRVEPRKVTGPAKQQQNATPPSNYAQIKKGNKQPHSNLSPFRPLQIHPSREEMKKPPSTLSSGCSRRENSKIPTTNGLGVPRAGNSDSGMEERCTLEEVAEASGDWDKKTQFENISDGEKIYENLPPAVLEAPAPPSRRPPPWNNIHGQQQTNVAVLPPLEDFPELYGRLVAVAFVDVRAKRTGGQQGSGRRRIRAAHQQLAELVGLRVDKSFDPAADSEAEFRRKSADFGSQLAQRLRRTEACSRKEFDWQVKKLQKILHELRTAKDGEVKYLAERTGGTLQKLFRRVISWK